MEIEVMNREISVKLMGLSEGLDLPSYATEGSAGMDLRAAINETIVLKPMQRMLIPTGISLEMPVDIEAQVRPKSGIAYKAGVTVLNTPGTVDSDFRGEVGVILINLGDKDYTIERNDKIAQLVFNRIEKVKLVQTDDLSDTNRGNGGFGSTGIK